MKVLVFLASGILEDGPVAFFSYEIISFFLTDLVFLRVLVFLGSCILEDGSVRFFHMIL